MAGRGRPRGSFALSDWELDEMAHHHRSGWTLMELARFYGVSTRTVSRMLRHMADEPLRADSSAAKRETD